MKKRALFFFLFLSFSHAAVVLAAPSITAEARVLKPKVKIGDDIRLLLRIEHPRTVTLIPPTKDLSIAPFEIKRIEPVPVIKGQNRVEETYRMTLTVFGTGELEIPPIPVRYQDAKGQDGQVMTAPVKVSVVSVGKKLTDKDDIRPIKGPAMADQMRFWMTLEAMLAAALAIFLAVRLILRFLKNLESAESRKSAPLRARIEMRRLKDKGFLEEKNYRDYYAGLSDVLRRYLERRFGFEACEETSTEILKDMESRLLSSDVLKATSRLLNECDLVKFAKFTPSYELAQELEGLLFGIIEATPPPEKGKK